MPIDPVLGVPGKDVDRNARTEEGVQQGKLR